MLDSSDINVYLAELAKTCNTKESLVMCGGASIVLLHNIRKSTEDLDAIKISDSLKSSAAEVSVRLGYPAELLNDNVIVTQSYTSNLLNYVELYKTYGNLSVYLVNTPALICMKLCSMRPGSNDKRDAVQLLERIKSKTSVEEIKKTFKEIYGTVSTLPMDSEQVLMDVFDTDWSSMLTDKESIDGFINLLESGSIDLVDIPKIALSKIKETPASLGLKYYNMPVEWHIKREDFDTCKVIPINILMNRDI